MKPIDIIKLAWKQAFEEWKQAYEDIKELPKNDNTLINVREKYDVLKELSQIINEQAGE